MDLNSSVFLSHSHHDETEVRLIQSWLLELQLKPWASFDDINSLDYLGVLAGEIRRCGCFVLVMSKHSMSSEIVKKEIQLAVESHKKIFIYQLEKNIPIEDKFEFIFTGVQRIESFKFKHDGLQRLAKIIFKEAGMSDQDTLIKIRGAHKAFRDSQLNEERNRQYLIRKWQDEYWNRQWVDGKYKSNISKIDSRFLCDYAKEIGLSDNDLAFARKNTRNKRQFVGFFYSVLRQKTASRQNLLTLEKIRIECQVSTNEVREMVNREKKLPILEPQSANSTKEAIDIDWLATLIISKQQIWEDETTVNRMQPDSRLEHKGKDKDRGTDKGKDKDIDKDGDENKGKDRAKDEDEVEHIMRYPEPLTKIMNDKFSFQVENLSKGANSDSRSIVDSKYMPRPDQVRATKRSTEHRYIRPTGTVFSDNAYLAESAIGETRKHNTRPENSEFVFGGQSVVLTEIRHGRRANKILMSKIEAVNSHYVFSGKGVKQELRQINLSANFTHITISDLSVKLHQAGENNHILIRYVPGNDDCKVLFQFVDAIGIPMKERETASSMSYSCEASSYASKEIELTNNQPPSKAKKRDSAFSCNDKYESASNDSGKGQANQDHKHEAGSVFLCEEKFLEITEYFLGMELNKLAVARIEIINNGYIFSGKGLGQSLNRIISSRAFTRIEVSDCNIWLHQDGYNNYFYAAVDSSKDDYNRFLAFLDSSHVHISKVSAKKAEANEANEHNLFDEEATGSSGEQISKEKHQDSDKAFVFKEQFLTITEYCRGKQIDRLWVTRIDNIGDEYLFSGKGFGKSLKKIKASRLFTRIEVSGSSIWLHQDAVQKSFFAVMDSSKDDCSRFLAFLESTNVPISKISANEVEPDQEAKDSLLDKVSARVKSAVNWIRVH